MRQVKDMTGQRFDRLTVLEQYASYRDPATGYRCEAQWLCRCDCGEYTVVRGSALRGGRVHSCGCLRREKSSERMREVGRRNGGKSHT